jgi:hypothetical protein
LRDEAELRAARQLRDSRIHYSSSRRRRLRPKTATIYERDLVLRYNVRFQNTFAGKLEQRWLGPYRVKELLKNGSMRLEELSGVELRGTFPPDQVKKFWSRDEDGMIELKGDDAGMSEEEEGGLSEQEGGTRNER